MRLPTGNEKIEVKLTFESSMPPTAATVKWPPASCPSQRNCAR